MQGIRVFTLIGAVTNEVTCIVPSSFVIHDIMDQEIPRLILSIRHFWRKRRRQKEKICSPIPPEEGPIPPPIGQLLLSIKIHSLDRQK